jgi:CTP-dependent riboflavin kinase
MQKAVMALLQAGHGVASGKNPDSPYPHGTITMQMPFFKDMGLDLTGYFAGTLNLAITPYEFKILRPDFHFKQVLWAEGFTAEDFSFVACNLIYTSNRYPAYIYYPHPETKVRHFHANNLVEVLAPRIDNINYGAALKLEYDSDKLAVVLAQ